MENYQLILDKTIENIIKTNLRPSLLLHVCCAPCSSYCLEYLTKYFDITLYFYNPNMSSLEEYNKRKLELVRFVNEFTPANSISIIDTGYDPENFDIIAKGLEDEPERGGRCYKCYKLRLEATAKLAKKHNDNTDSSLEHFDYFTTTLSISPHKNSVWLNELGRELSAKYDVPYLFSDFKKKNGYIRSIELSNEYNLYRQNFCGCKYSYEASLKQANNNESSNKGV